MVGCEKEKEEEKEPVISESVKMFMNITPNSDYSDVRDIMGKAEKEGLGRFKESRYCLTFEFEVVDEEAEEERNTSEYLSEVSGWNSEMREEGHPMYYSEYQGARIDVMYRNKMESITYRAEDDNEKMGRIEYGFDSGCVTDSFDIDGSYSLILERMKEGCSKEEVDELLIELNDKVVDEKEREKRMEEIEKMEDEVWESEFGE